MGQAMNEVAVPGQYEQPRSGAVQSPRDEQRSATKHLGQQVGYERRFAVIVTAGEPDRLMKKEVLGGCRRVDRPVTHHHGFGPDFPCRVPTDLAVDADLATSNQVSRLSAGSKPGTGQNCVKTHPSGFCRVRSSHRRPSLSGQLALRGGWALSAIDAADYNAPPIFDARGIMGIRVCKFGGSSVADATQLRKVRAIVENCDDRRFIVPSAPGRQMPDDEKVTDLLYRAHEAAAQGQSIEPLFDQISERYRKIVGDLGLEFDLDPALSEAHDQIRDGASVSYTASRGEYLIGLVMAKLLDRPFIDPVEMIRFDESGRFLPKETHAAVAARLADEETGVIPGFYGALPDGSIQTFSRGGSDITGAIISRGIGAEIYENWTDVSGLLMADPRIVRAPHTIREMTYRELRELAYMGATVLHDEAIFPVRAANIPVHILNTNDPDSAGTRIRRAGNDRPPAGRITGIAGRKDFTIIALEKTLMNAEIGFGRRVLAVLERHGVSWEHIPSGIDTLSIVIKSDVVEARIDSLVEEIDAECTPDSIEIHSGIALIATVGRGMSHAPGTAARLFGALARAGINIRMIDQGSSELNIIVGVENADFVRTVQAIYDEFVPPPAS